MTAGDSFVYHIEPSRSRMLARDRARRRERGFILAAIPMKVWLIGAGLLVLAAIGFTLWNHYTGLLEDNATLKANNAKLEIAIDLKDTEIAAMQDQRASRVAQAEVTRKELDASREKVHDLRDKLAKHDLGALIVARPKTVSGIMKRGTRKRFKSIEDAANAIKAD